MKPDVIFQASPHKLRSGAWGARVADPSVRVGDMLRVESKRGGVWEALVASVVGVDDDGALVKTMKVGLSVEHCWLCKPTATRTIKTDSHCDSCGARPHYQEATV